jgi:hypothetical protein
MRGILKNFSIQRSSADDYNILDIDCSLFAGSGEGPSLNYNVMGLDTGRRRQGPGPGGSNLGPLKDPVHYSVRSLLASPVKISLSSSASIRI